MNGLDQYEPSASTRSNKVRDLWRERSKTPHLRLLRLACPHGLRHDKRLGGSRQGRRSVWGRHKRRDGATASGRRCAIVGRAVQFTDLLLRGFPGLGPDSYSTTRDHSLFELVVRFHGKSPTSSFLLCSLFGDALGLPRRADPSFPVRRIGKQLPDAIVCCSLCSPSDRRRSCAGYLVRCSTSGLTCRSTWRSWTPRVRRA